jgi:hypothetical protein
MTTGAAPLRSVRGEIVGATCVVQDISLIKQSCCNAVNRSQTSGIASRFALR